MRKDLLKYYQDVTRQRGYPPFPIEVARAFGMEVVDVVPEMKEIHDHLLNVLRTVEIPKQHRPAVVTARLKPLSPPPAKAKVNLKRFTGRNGWPDARDRMNYWRDEAANVYLRGTVDYVLHDEQIALTPETEAWFYSADAVERPTYRPGSRRFLEQVAEKTTAGCATDRAKALALVRLIGDTEKNPYRHHDPAFEPFLGGTEEEVLKKAWRMCNEISRVLVFLCQVAGIPARGVFAFTDPLTCVPGHAMTEIFFDGKWNLVEQNQGALYPRSDGYFASLKELRDDPAIINARTGVGAMRGMGMCHAAFSGPCSILNYRIDRIDHYSYIWQTNAPA